LVLLPTMHRPTSRLAAFNAVVCTRSNLVALGQDNHGPTHNTAVANNVLVGGPGKLVMVPGGTHDHRQGNIVWGGTGGDMPSSGTAQSTRLARCHPTLGARAPGTTRPHGWTT
jgi:hypothetical protein